MSAKSKSLFKGRFIVIEGLDGVGKSAQISFIQKYLQSKKISVFCTYEPGGSKLGDYVRNAVKNQYFDELTDTFMLLAARRQHIVEQIKPALEKGVWVISDRFFHSTVVYQGHRSKEKISLIASCHRHLLADVLPDLSIILDLPTDQLKERIKNRSFLPDALESNRYSDMKMLDSMRESYLQLCDNEFSRETCVIPATDSMDLVFENIKKYLDPLVLATV